MTTTPNKRRDPDQTPGAQLNAPGVYSKIGSFDPAFFRGRRLIGVRRLIEKIRCISLRIPSIVILYDRKKMLRIWTESADLDPWTYVNKYTFQRLQIALTLWARTILVVFQKNLLVLTYFKLHSKSADYLHKIKYPCVSIGTSVLHSKGLSFLFWQTSFYKCGWIVLT